MRRVFLGTAKEGELIYDEPKAVEEYLRYDVPGKVEVIIRKPKNKRTLPQNKYYWSVIVEMISNETGNSKDDIHKLLKYEFLSEVADIPSGEEYLYIRSSTELTTIEWEDYNKKCRMWASDNLNMFIPKPNEYET